MTKNVLVTGGAGYVGSHTCKALAAAGYFPIVFDNLSEGHEWAVKWGPFVEGDLMDTERIRRLVQEEKPEAILHFAASAYVGESVQNPLKYYMNNVAGTVSLLTAIKGTGVRKLVFSSTCATYGMPQALPITEDSRQEPINPYGQSKLMVEFMLRDLVRNQAVSAAALRYFNAAGADADGDTGEVHKPETHIIPLAIEAALQGTPFQILGDDYPTSDGTCVRDYIHVTDLADAHVRALKYLDSEPLGFYAWNLGTGRGYSVREILEHVKGITGKEIQIVIKPKRPGDPPALVAAGTKAARDLGWEPKNSELSRIVQSAYAWRQKAEQAGLI